MRQSTRKGSVPQLYGQSSCIIGVLDIVWMGCGDIGVVHDTLYHDGKVSWCVMSC